MKTSDWEVFELFIFIQLRAHNSKAITGIIIAEGIFMTTHTKAAARKSVKVIILPPPSASRPCFAFGVAAHVWHLKRWIEWLSFTTWLKNLTCYQVFLSCLCLGKDLNLALARLLLLLLVMISGLVCHHPHLATEALVLHHRLMVSLQNNNQDLFCTRKISFFAQDSFIHHFYQENWFALAAPSIQIDIAVQLHLKTTYKIIN